MAEEWRSTHHPNYEVSNLGRIRSWAAIGKRKSNNRATTPRILKGSRSSTTTYPSVVFPGNVGHLVHRLVATAFLGPCPKGQEVLHKDDDRMNGRLDNLEYGTRLKNIQDCIARGRFTRRQFSEEQVRAIRAYLDTQRKDTPARRLRAGVTAQVANQYGVSKQCIRELWTRATYLHV